MDRRIESYRTIGAAYGRIACQASVTAIISRIRDVIYDSFRESSIREIPRCRGIAHGKTRQSTDLAGASARIVVVDESPCRRSVSRFCPNPRRLRPATLILDANAPEEYTNQTLNALENVYVTPAPSRSHYLGTRVPNRPSGGLLIALRAGNANRACTRSSRRFIRRRPHPPPLPRERSERSEVGEGGGGGRPSQK